MVQSKCSISSMKTSCRNKDLARTLNFDKGFRMPKPLGVQLVGNV